MGPKYLLVLLFVASCNNGICARHSDCAHDQTCTAAGICTGAPDAGTDTPTIDAPTTSATDADTTDAGGP